MAYQRFFLFIVAVFGLTFSAQAAELYRIGEGTRFPIQGKEADWIDGDYVLKSDVLIAVVAHPTKTRDANMTVRAVGAGIIDLTRRDVQSDQLSAFYPAAGRYGFSDDSTTKMVAVKGDEAILRLQSSRSVAGDESTCVVEYRLRNGQPFITCQVSVTGKTVAGFRPSDSVRADRTFEFGVLKDMGVAFCEDENFRQTYGFQALGSSGDPRWDRNRARRVTYFLERPKSSETIEWQTRIFPASSSMDLAGIVAGAPETTILVAGAVGDQPRIKLSIVKSDPALPKDSTSWRCAPDGKSVVHLMPGKYRVRAQAIGHQPVEKDVDVADNPSTVELKLGPATAVNAKVVDGTGKPIPCKVSFYGREVDGKSTPTPNFGLDSQSGSVGNTVYSADGEFIRSIPPGAYEAVISYGPEYDAEFKDIVVSEGESLELSVTLKRVVDTEGWVSAELHSHSSPSGDNTSDQLGRVENLVCEHLEFAPCTEHQRIESYDDQLKILGAEARMATCTGMELTGSLLPINHQNAFPLKWSPYEQDGGGPRVSSNPVTQIARIAMWDDKADKVVQSNHPNLRQMLRDKNLDGTEDGGYSEMLDYMDVIEIHPPSDIFKPLDQIEEQKDRDNNRMQHWMNLIASGRYIPGVVNTDAHYNWHGSGWMRNWIASSTDDPAKIGVPEMIKSLEAGRIVMSTGPFMNFSIEHASLKESARIGDRVKIEDGKAQAVVKVQCPNWMDVNRVEIFVNGKLVPELSRRRSTHPDAFADGVVKFDQKLKFELKGDSFVIAAAIGEKLKLGRVMGNKFGNRPPVVVSNPIFVSVE